MAAAFISYRREDSAGYAGRLHEDLEERLGRAQVFRDAESLRAGQDFVAAIEERLRACHVCFVLIGPGWLDARTSAGARRLDSADDYVAMEIAAALARPGMLVVPVLVGGATMPASDHLPERLRPLARRHAVTVRDETWEPDVDRLAAVVRGTGHAGRASVRTGFSRRSVLAGIAALLLTGIAAVVGITLWSFDSAAPDSSGGPAVPDGTYAIEIPATGMEIAHGTMIYTPLAGAVRRSGGTSTLWLRVRASNEGAYDANLWDDSFRLAADGSALAPSSGLNEVLGGHSIRQVIVRFEIPGAPRSAVVRISHGGRTGEFPLDLTPTGEPPRHEETDPGDALSRATLATLITDARPLVEHDGLSATLVRVTTRRFANVVRVIVSVRMANATRYDRATGDLVLRLVEGGEVKAPASGPSDIVKPGSTFSGDTVFEVAPATRSAALQAAIGNARHRIDLTIR